MHAINRLSTIAIKRAKPGKHADGGGLYLTVDRAGNRSWIYRWRDRVSRKLRDHGLGPAWDVSLEQARARAKECRAMVREGRDPIAEARQAVLDRRLELAKQVTFGDCAEQYIASNKAGWRNPKHAAQWASTLKTYAKPINSLPVEVVDTGLVLKCIEPQWATKNETMSRVRQRIERVLDWAAVRGYREGENPARWRGHLDALLPRPAKVQKVQHRAALPFREAAAFMADLRDVDSTAASALAFQILTAARPGEACGAQWAEIDLERKVWVIPPERMKGGKEHRIPLSVPTIELLRALQRGSNAVFVGSTGKAITTAATMKLLKRLRPGYTCHGFRSSFRDWAGELTKFAREVIEHCLAHHIKDQAEAAYRRGDALARRAKVMAAWADYLARVNVDGQVVHLRKSA